MKHTRVLGLWTFTAILIAGITAAPVTRVMAQEGDTPAVQEDLTKAQEYYRQGVELMNSSRYLDAVERFQLALDEDPEYLDAQRRLAYVYTQMGQTEPDYYQDALDVYEDLKTELPEDDIDVRKNIAFVQAAMDDIDDAIATYQEILEIDPDDCVIWKQIGGAQKLLADRMRADEQTDSPEFATRVDEAVKAYSKVAELCPDDVENLDTLAKLYWDTGQKDEAGEVYARMLKLDPENLDVLAKAAYIDKEAEKWDSAAELYEKILEIDPTRLNDRKQYANALQKAGRLKEAAVQFEKIIAEDPSENSLYCNMCMLYALDAKNGEKAIEIAMKGISENAPVEGCLTYGWGKGLELRGTNLVKQGDYDRAITTYREAKLKFSSILGDASFGGHAKKQMDRIDQLITIAEQTREKARQGR